MHHNPEDARHDAAPCTPRDGRICPGVRSCGEMELLNLILDNIYNGVMITDAEGYVTHFNTPYGVFLGVDPEEQIGKHCTEVVENSRMHLVARSGKAEINLTQSIKGQNMVVQRIPVRKDGKVIAVFGQVMFKDVKDVDRLARKLSLLESKVQLYEEQLKSLRSTRYNLDSIVGVSPALQSLKEQALRAAAANLPVLITGESGTGKELFAQAIHHASPRSSKPFVRINCAAIPKDLMESELFGYEEGAFTGAKSKGKPGKFELAHNGTVFLDEIGDLPLEMQPKLLRVLEEKELERVGGTSVTHVDFRLIAATNQDLDRMMAQGRFRKDLFYRLSVIPIHVPPLRERREDIMPLAQAVLRRHVSDRSPDAIRIDPDAQATFARYDWPGNARELCNLIQGIVYSLEGNTIHTHHLPFSLFRRERKAVDHGSFSLAQMLDKAERDAIRFALVHAGNNKVKAAKLLGIHRTLLYKKMKKHGLPLE
ncbi:MAG: sigma 54-interacting transcriptional regulator [Thermodesulfobacteriota bacterium]